jgi:hypothetical protein
MMGADVTSSKFFCRHTPRPFQEMTGREQAFRFHFLKELNQIPILFFSRQDVILPTRIYYY